MRAVPVGDPFEVRILSSGVVARCEAKGPAKFAWVPYGATADSSWRKLLDLPVSLEEGVTLGRFLHLFDVPDPHEDEALFHAFTSLPDGPFGRWVKAVSEPGIKPLPDHIVSMEVGPVAAVLPDGRVVGYLPAPLAVISQGQVDDPFWRGQERYEWHPGDFPLAQLRALPLRIEEPRNPGTQPSVYSPSGLLSFRGLIQSVFHWCAPGNRLSDLTEPDLRRFVGEVKVCDETLQEMLGLPE